MIRDAHGKGVKVGDLSDEEKNNFIFEETVDSIQKRVRNSIKYNSLIEWNSRNKGET